MLALRRRFIGHKFRLRVHFLRLFLCRRCAYFMTYRDHSLLKIRRRERMQVKTYLYIYIMDKWYLYVCIHILSLYVSAVFREIKPRILRVFNLVLRSCFLPDRFECRKMLSFWRYYVTLLIIMLCS